MIGNPVVLSLFDGMGCLEIALLELGIKPKTYYSSEIDKFANNQTKLNFTDNIQLGNVCDVDVSKLERIDFLGGGSPCQSFSFAGKRKGMSTKCKIMITRLDQYLELKEQNFEFEGQSYLFWEYMRILTDIRKYNPDVIFLLENVEMGKHWERVLSEAIGIYAVHINSALVCAQNRRRIYFTNIKTRQEGLFGELHSDIPQPKDRGILLKDILESEVDEKYYLSYKMMNAITYQDKGNGEVANLNKGGERGSVYKTDCKMSTIAATDYKQPKQIIEGLKPFGTSQDQKISPVNGKSQTMSCGNYNQPKIIDTCIVAMRGRNPDNPSDRTSGTLDVKSQRQKTLLNNQRIRRLTPKECAKLQGIPGWYIWECSDSQIYKMCGNGWQIDTIEHIISFLKIDKTL